MRPFSSTAIIATILLGVVTTLAPWSVVNAQTPAATYSIAPGSGSYGVGKTFVVAVVADASQTFNSGNAVVNFDKELLEPASSNSAGTVSFEGGNTTALSGKKTLIEITFRALKEGTASVGFTSGSILAADGKGTDILGAKNGASFTIVAGGNDTPQTPTTPAPQTVSAGPLPDSPEITSSSHPSETAYTNGAKAKFTWNLPDDVTVVRLSLDTNPRTTPTTSYDPALSEKEFDQLSDGEMYFHLRYKNDAGWGPTAHRKILVDKTPPPSFTLGIVPDATTTDVVVQFNATDTLSMISHYELSVDSANPIKIKPDEVKNGSYLLLGQLPGNHKMKVTAFDRAGNATAEEGNFTVAGSATTKKTDEEEEKPIDWRLFIDIGLFACIIFLLGHLWHSRSTFRNEKYLVKREADELRDNLGNIFAAVREEVGEQVGRLFQKPNPSAQDREATKNINEAIDLSEELLSKEVEDVRKLLK
jgi:hypothetical protein